MTSEERRAYHSAYYQKNKGYFLAKTAEWRKANPGKVKEHRRRFGGAYARNSRLKHRYGITSVEHEQLLKLQGGACAVCGTHNPGRSGWHTDHCHDTNIVRGVLCAKCNLMLGHACDDPSILEAAIRYLAK